MFTFLKEIPCFSRPNITGWAGFIIIVLAWLPNFTILDLLATFIGSALIASNDKQITGFVKGIISPFVNKKIDESFDDDIFDNNNAPRA